MKEIRGSEIIEPFREASADMDALAHTLVPLGGIGLQYEDVSKSISTPLQIRSDGKPVSADALIVLKSGGTIYR